MQNTTKPLNDDEIIQSVWNHFKIELRRVSGDFVVWYAPIGYSHAKVREINQFVIALMS
ncbi:MAG: hypothetical protein JWQ84_1889 [Mucilaginibacter sp.]|nr:hypothetical protein [Mucilaginibacter sp.]